MTADPNAKTGPGTDQEPGKTPPASAKAPTLGQHVGSRGDEIFKRSMDDLSRRLGEKTAGQTPTNPQAAGEARRAALEAYDQARARRLKLALSAAGSAVGAASIAYFIVMIGSPLEPSSQGVTASREPAMPVAMAAAQPPATLPQSTSPSPPSSPAPAASAPVPPARATAVLATPVLGRAAAAAASAPPQPEAPSPPAILQATPATPDQPNLEQATLRRDQVREVQTRLRSFGFDPGPVDGAAGPRTESAIARYQEGRAQPQTGKADHQLLEQLRQDPAPQIAPPPPPVQVAQRAPRPSAPRTSNLPAPRSDALEPIRIASLRLSQWLESLTR